MIWPIDEPSSTGGRLDWPGTTAWPAPQQPSPATIGGATATSQHCGTAGAAQQGSATTVGQQAADDCGRLSIERRQRPAQTGLTIKTPHSKAAVWQRTQNRKLFDMDASPRENVLLNFDSE
jgi:hypothetical protein